MTDSIDADAKRYATCDYDDPNKPVYRPSDDPLEFKRSVRFAAIDVMILTFAARRHAERLTRIGVCPPDIAALIRQDTAYITNVVNDRMPPAVTARTASPSLAHVGPRGEVGTAIANATTGVPGTLGGPGANVGDGHKSVHPDKRL